MEEIKSSRYLKDRALEWLQSKVFPFWSRSGIDSVNGSFIESVSFQGLPLQEPRRALVQARQIYSFAEGARLKVIDQNHAEQLIEKATDSYIRNFSLPTGAFAYSINDSGILNSDAELYTQAFALFGLSQAYEITQRQEYKVAALKIYSYLDTERRNKGGGFTEVKKGQMFFQSNPHMHLFEAAISWWQVDKDPKWSALACELYILATNRFIDKSTGFLAEHFDEYWNPIRKGDHFIFEPGHQFEWSWLFWQFHKLNLHNFLQSLNSTATKNSIQTSQSLFLLAEQYGLSADRKLAYDEVLSDGTPHKRSSRFWPQTERLKAAVVQGNFEVADITIQSLFKYFLVEESGLWKDTLLENGNYADVPAKASSLYHIINAISEYVNYR